MMGENCKLLQRLLVSSAVRCSHQPHIERDPVLGTICIVAVSLHTLFSPQGNNACLSAPVVILTNKPDPARLAEGLRCTSAGLLCISSDRAPAASPQQLQS